MRPITGFSTGSPFRPTRRPQTRAAAMLAAALATAALAAAPAWAGAGATPAKNAADAVKASVKPGRDDAVGAVSKNGDPDGGTSGGNPAGDAQLRAQLDQLGYKYQLDEDGDYVLTFGLDGQRSQMAYVLSRTQRYGSLKVREIWSPAYRSADGGALPAAIANRLLEDGQLSKLGGWVSQDGVAVFVVKLDADASPRTLDDALDYAVRAADQMEAELTPAQDEF